MALNPELIGRTYTWGQVYEVAVEKLRDFATAIGDTNPAYHDEAAAHAYGHPSLVAPPTFAFVIAQKANAAAVLDPDLGLDYSRVVHGEQRFVYRRPLYAGDRIVATTRIDNIRAAAGNDLLTTRCDLSTVDGEHVVSTYSVIVSRGTADA